MHLFLRFRTSQRNKQQQTNFFNFLLIIAAFIGQRLIAMFFYLFVDTLKQSLQ